MLFSPSTFQLACKEKTIRLDKEKSLVYNKQIFEDFVRTSQTQFFEENPTIDCENVIIKSYLRPNFGQVFFLENPFDRKISFDKNNRNTAFHLDNQSSTQLVGSKIMAHFAEISIRINNYSEKDKIVLRDKFSEGKTMAFSHQVDYLELSLYNYVPILVKFLLESLYECSVLGVEIEFLNFEFDLVGTSQSQVKQAINACLDDIFGKLPSKK